MSQSTLAVPASEKILRRIRSVQAQIDKAQASGSNESECLNKVRGAYVVDLMDILNEESQELPREERTSYNLVSTEAWIQERIYS